VELLLLGLGIPVYVNDGLGRMFCGRPLLIGKSRFVSEGCDGFEVNDPFSSLWLCEICIELFGSLPRFGC
jgi:hypothetical protein